MIDLNVTTLESFLGLSINHPDVIAFFEDNLGNITREEFYGLLEFKSEGCCVIFQEAPWVLDGHYNDPSELFVQGFHFYGQPIDGYSTYRGLLPKETTMKNSREEIIDNFGSPDESGGGENIPLVGIAPSWIKYRYKQAFVWFEFDVGNEIKLFTLALPIQM